MAEKIVSPGVFSTEIDASYLPAAIGDIGACVIGPTVKGPALVPTVVESYSEYQAKFGDTFKSGSNYFQYLTSHAAENYLKHGSKLTVVRILDGAYTPATASIANDDDAAVIGITTLTDGAGLNNVGASLTGSNNTLLSGSKDNIRWEVSTNNGKKGTFTLLIRRGNDTQTRKTVMETWNNLSLDPNSNNYCEKVIGNQNVVIKQMDTSDPFLQFIGDYPNKSKYIRISTQVQTPDYFDENGVIRDDILSASLPAVGSGSLQGSFGGGANGVAGFDAIGNLSEDANGIGDTEAYNFYDSIAKQSQGFPMTLDDDEGITAYKAALNLISNQDEYDINLLMLPGVIDNLGSAHASITAKAIEVCENRGDCFLIYDPVQYGNGSDLLGTATGKAENRDSNYAAVYWPWLQISDSQTGKMRWVPPSCVIPGAFAFNDKVSAPWFAPAGLNRGGLSTVIQAERKLTHANRDTLYESNVNPIATFPGQGVVVWGQKTLQKKASALDRVNVRRLMIKVKKFIASSSRFLVFEQNTQQTRNRFLNIVNPYLEQVQANSGLSAFKVVMDDTNNTPDIVDRNILYGQLFLQPTRTAEFIVLDFTIQPTGAAFPE